MNRVEDGPDRCHKCPAQKYESEKYESEKCESEKCESEKRIPSEPCPLLLDRTIVIDVVASILSLETGDSWALSCSEANLRILPSIKSSFRFSAVYMLPDFRSINS